jgi:hypothetical protein
MAITRVSVKSVPVDILIICAELVTGKSIPVIVAIARLPMDRLLAWVMLCMGALVGTLFSVYSSRVVVGLTMMGFVNRLVQLGFSMVLSLSLLLSIGKGLHAERGVALCIIPAFSVVVQTLPQRVSTAMVAFILNFGAFYVCMVTMAWAQPESLLVASTLSDEAASMGRTVGRALQPEPLLITDTFADEAASVGQTVGRALQLFVLAFYACIQHAPTLVYFGTDAGPAVYASHHLARHAHYSLFIALVSAWLRVCVWSSVCFFQNNFMHIVLGGSTGGPEWDWFGCFVYMTALLYSACWTATQLREQVMPRLSSQELDRLKLVVLTLALSTLLRQGGDQGMFILTTVLAGLSVLTTFLTLKALN